MDKTDKWISKGLKISRNRVGMWIVDCPDGKFYAITSTLALMQKAHPPDKEEEK